MGKTYQNRSMSQTLIPYYHPLYEWWLQVTNGNQGKPVMVLQSSSSKFRDYPPPKIGKTSQNIPLT